MTGLLVSVSVAGCGACGRESSPGGFGECVLCGNFPIGAVPPAPVVVVRRDPRTCVPCPGCGRLKSTRAALCFRCANADRSYWTRERIVEAIQWHVARLGEVPRKVDWLRARPENPTFQWVVKRFGSWGNAVEAAGFERTRGRRRRSTPAYLRRRTFFERERCAVHPIQAVPHRRAG